ncbi:MAG: invasion associated locus B family protein [Bradyrhizobiaceae bacterium]|nr:invasion associated locus B family protein [Bradyrhizobiaceae bacterium]
MAAWSAEKEKEGSGQKAAPAAAEKAAAQAEPRLPNGASAINETYGDWTVDCRLVEGQKQCMIMQAQINNQTRQRLFEIQLHAPKDARTEGTILMPFGLKLDTGAIATLDDKDIGQPLRFSTCTPQGCLMQVSFPAATVDSMKKGKTLEIASLNFANGEVVSFKVSLEGFANASARVIELSK